MGHICRKWRKAPKSPARWYGPVVPVGDTFAVVHGTFYGGNETYQFNWRESTWEAKWSLPTNGRWYVKGVAVPTRAIGGCK